MTSESIILMYIELKIQALPGFPQNVQDLTMNPTRPTHPRRSHPDSFAMCLVRWCRVTNCDFHWSPCHWLGLPHRGHWVPTYRKFRYGTANTSAVLIPG